MSPTSPSSANTNTLSQTFSLQYPLNNNSPQLAETRMSSVLTRQNEVVVKHENVVIEEHMRNATSTPNLALAGQHEDAVEFFF
jgi:hypothetical protein